MEILHAVILGVSMNHEWQNDICKMCGVTASQYMNQADWDILFCPGQPQMILPLQKTTCCNFPAIIYLGGKWLCESCGKLDGELNTNKTGNYTITKCTCGALKVHGDNTPGHYNDCDLRKRK